MDVRLIIGIMVMVLSNPSRLKKFYLEISRKSTLGLFFVLFLSIGLLVIVQQLQHPHDIRQRASSPNTVEFGFNTHVSAANNNLDINKFEQNVDTLAANGQKWIRFNVIDFEVASEGPNSFVTITPGPTPTPAPGLLRVYTNPVAEATITVTDVSNQVVAQNTWSINWPSLPAGQYTVSYTYPYSAINGLPVLVPAPSKVTIYSNKTTTVVADLTAGTSVTQSVQGLSSSSIIWNNTNLAVYDQAIDYAIKKGLKIFLVTNTPAFAKAYVLDDYKTVTDEYYSYLSSRWAGKIAVWQIFNEADTHNFRDYSVMGDLTDSYLADLNSVIAVAKTSIKANDPDTLVTTNVSGYPMNDTTVTEWYKFFDAVKDNLDIMSLDMYPAPDLTEISNLGSRVDSLRLRYGKDIAVSEAGVCTMTAGISEADQASYLTKSIDSLKLSSVNIILLYEIMDEDTSGGLCEGTFGIVKTDGLHKASFDPVMADMLAFPALTQIPTISPTLPIISQTQIPTSTPTLLTETPSVALTPNSTLTPIPIPTSIPTRTPTLVPSVIPSPTHTYIVGDINHDGKVDVQDFSYLLSNWGTNNSLVDLNHDGTVNIFDLSIMLSNWKP